MNIIHQSKDKPLFEDLLWSRPENKALAGKLLIIGGCDSSIFAPIKAYEHAIASGAGEVKVIMPISTKKLLGPLVHGLPIVFVESNPSGSFSINSQADFNAYIAWADTILFAGDFSKNSETNILINTLVHNYDKFMVIVNDAVDVFYIDSTNINNTNILLVLDFGQLQKLVKNIKTEVHFTSTMNNNIISHDLCSLSSILQCYIMLVSNKFVQIANNGELINTKGMMSGISNTQIATISAIWGMQLPNNRLHAIATSITQI